MAIKSMQIKSMALTIHKLEFLADHVKTNEENVDLNISCTPVQWSELEEA